MFNTSEVFKPGKLSIIMDGGAGSSGKGKIGSFITQHADNWQFACNAYSPQAGHWCVEEDGKYFYQTFNSCAHLDKYEKLYLGPGSVIELKALKREIEESNIDPCKIGISPVAVILQDIDKSFERGETDLDGNPIDHSEGTMKFGSTCHGAGAARARRALRRPNIVLARDCDSLKPLICDTTAEIIARLELGQAGLLELAQGFQLSYLLDRFYPYTTSRNITIAAGLDDMMIPIVYAGNVIINFRTYPIRINSNKYIGDNGKHLTWDEIQEYDKTGKTYEVYKGDSGPGYDDQDETSWESVTANSGSPEPIIEITSVTKLPRRVFTWSQQNLLQAIQMNDTRNKKLSTENQIMISINFANYIDHMMAGKRGVGNNHLTEKFKGWLDQAIPSLPAGVALRFIGTGPFSNDMVVI